MTPTYEQIQRDYPKYMSKEQMRLVCHISKKTAKLLLQTGLVPCIDSGKKTRNYQIATADVIEYLKQRDAAPEKYILPENSYMKSNTTAMLYADFSVDYLIEPLLSDEYPDVLSVQQAAVLSDVTPDTVKAWARKKHLKAFIKNNAYLIPKMALIEYLSSSRHKRNLIWKLNNMEKRQQSVVIQ